MLLLLSLLPYAHATGPVAPPKPAPIAPTAAPTTAPTAAPTTAPPVGSPEPRSGGGGIVVRLDAGSAQLTAPVVVTLTSEGGAAREVALADAGTGGDVTAGDGIWSAAGQAEGSSFKVAVKSGDQSWDAGEVKWEPTATQRDLSLFLVDGKMTAEAGTSGSASPAAGAPPAGGSLAPASAPGGGPVTAAGGGDALAYVAFGVGGVLLAAIAWMWVNGSGRGLPKHVVRVAEPGAFGPATPAFSAFSQWVVAPEDREILVSALLGTLARTRRVLVAAPTGATVPAVMGGPVYRTAKTGVNELVDALDALAEGGGAVALVDLRADAGAALAPITRKVEPGTGVIAIVDAPVENGIPALRCTRTPGGFTLAIENQTVSLRIVDGALTL